MVVQIMMCHLGAGIHSNSRDKRKLYTDVLQKCSTQFLLAVAAEGADLLAALASSSQVIEASPLTNTGFGSSLNIDGEVECDSSVLVYKAGKYSQASVCCCKDKFPITKSIQLLQDQLELNRFGITRPIFIADTNDYNSELVSEAATLKFNAYNEMMAAAEVSDTIGLAIVRQDKVISCCSSGGNMFKQKGRVGSAAVIGASHYHLERGNHRIVLMCSGNGEDIMLMDLCRSACRYILDQVDTWEGSYSDLLVQSVIDTAKHVNLKALADEEGHTMIYVGVYGLLELNNGRNKILVMCHSTESFIVSYTIGSKVRHIFSQATTRQEQKLFRRYEKCLLL